MWYVALRVCKSTKKPGGAFGQPVTDMNIAPTPTEVTVRDHHIPVAESTVSHLPDSLIAPGDTVESAQAGRSLVGGKEVVSATVSYVIILMVPLISRRSDVLKAWTLSLSPSSDDIPRRQ